MSYGIYKRQMAVYERRQSMLADCWQGFKYAAKAAFWLFVGYGYLLIGFSL